MNIAPGAEMIYYAHSSTIAMVSTISSMKLVRYTTSLQVKWISTKTAPLLPLRKKRQTIFQFASNAEFITNSPEINSSIVIIITIMWLQKRHPTFSLLSQQILTFVKYYVCDFCLDLLIFAPLAPAKPSHFFPTFSASINLV